jgi:hypothetical protein
MADARRFILEAVIYPANNGVLAVKDGNVKAPLNPVHLPKIGDNGPHDFTPLHHLPAVLLDERLPVFAFIRFMKATAPSPAKVEKVGSVISLRCQSEHRTSAGITGLPGLPTNAVYRL